MHIRFARLVLGVVVGLALLSGGAAAQASSLSQTQISAIIGLLQSFGADQSVIANVTTSLGGQVLPGNQTCVDLSHNLASGALDAANGGDVTRLQQFLGVRQTGYFGPQTEIAVQNWQSANGIVSSGAPDTNGYGYVGAKTRKAMACDGGIVPVIRPVIRPPVCAAGELYSAETAQCVLAPRQASGTIDGGVIPVKSNGTITISGTTKGVVNGVMVFISTYDYGNVGYSVLNGQIGKDGIYKNIVPLNSDGSWNTQFVWNVSGNAPLYVYLFDKDATYQYGAEAHASLAPKATVVVSGASATCVAPHITLPYPLPGYSLELYPTNVGAGQLFSADQTVTYSALSLPSWMSLSGNKVTFNTIPSPGAYSFTITATNSCGKSDAETIPVTVSANNLIPTATIDQSSLSANIGGNVPGTIVLSGSAANTDRIGVAIKGQQTAFATVVGGRWIATMTSVYPNTYTVQVLNEATTGSKEEILTSGILHVSGQTLNTPTATIDQSSLNPSANTAFTLSGTATGVQSVRVAIGHTNQNYFQSTPLTITNGRWQVQESTGLPADSYSVGVYGYSDSAGSQPVTNAGEGGVLIGTTLTVAPYWAALPLCPATAVSQRGLNNQTFACKCPPNFGVSTIWGFAGAVYTDDSNICAAGAQVGQLNQSSGGEVDYQIKPGQNSYDAGALNGFTSQSWGAWPGSFQIVGPKG